MIGDTNKVVCWPRPSKRARCPMLWTLRRKWPCLMVSSALRGPLIRHRVLILRISVGSGEPSGRFIGWLPDVPLLESHRSPAGPEAGVSISSKRGGCGGVSMICTSYSSWFSGRKCPFRRRPEWVWRVHSATGARPSGCRNTRQALSVWLDRDVREFRTSLQPEGRAPIASHSLSKKPCMEQGTATQSLE
jgi:hypothetical protein